MFQGEPFIQMHRVRYRVISLQSYNGEGVDAQFGAENTEKTGELTSGRHLPSDGVHSELAKSRGVDHGQQTCNSGEKVLSWLSEYVRLVRKLEVVNSDEKLTQINTHEEICCGQIAYQKSGHIHFTSGEYEDEYNGSIAEHG